MNNKYEYKMPVDGTLRRGNISSNLAFFLLVNTGSIFGQWEGKIRVEDQKRLLGRSFGKKNIIINGNTESFEIWKSVCFGTDFDSRSCCWTELENWKPSF